MPRRLNHAFASPIPQRSLHTTSKVVSHVAWMLHLPPRNPNRSWGTPLFSSACHVQAVKRLAGSGISMVPNCHCAALFCEVSREM
jgi:hypothetical protein